MVLLSPSASGIGRVELYDVRQTLSIGGNTHLKTPLQKKTEKNIIRLCDCLSVTPAPEETCPPNCGAFYVNTPKRTYTFASDICQEWVCALCQLAFQKNLGDTEKRELQRGEHGTSMADNDLYSAWKADCALPLSQYLVTVQSTEASRRCKLVGDYFLSSDTEALQLLEVQTEQCVYCWPYHGLRRFGPVQGGFSIEAGRRCASGEGQFIFQTKHGSQIHQSVDEAIALKSVQDKGTKHSPQPPNFSTNYNVSDQEEGSTGSLTNYSDNHFQPDPPVESPEPEIEPDCEAYTTIKYSSHLTPPKMGLLMHTTWATRSLHGDREVEDEEEEEDDDEQRCRSLNAISLQDVGDDSIYYNLRSWIREREGEAQVEPESASSGLDCAYATVNIPLSSSSLSDPNAHPRPPTNPLPQVLAKPQHQVQPKPQYQPDVQHQFSPFQTQSQGQKEKYSEEEENARRDSLTVTPIEFPVNFKQKLSELLGKDLAKVQQAPPLGGEDTPMLDRY